MMEPNWVRIKITIFQITRPRFFNFMFYVAAIYSNFWLRKLACSLCPIFDNGLIFQEQQFHYNISASTITWMAWQTGRWQAFMLNWWYFCTVQSQCCLVLCCWSNVSGKMRAFISSLFEWRRGWSDFLHCLFCFLR